MADLQTLLEQEIPNGRQALLESHHNLQKVATYCDHRYLEDDNKKAALEETKNYTTQSLASVAYQINTLASNLLHMLDLQAAQVTSMDSAIDNISQTVDIHKEKVARREIGLLTTNKVMKMNPLIVKPANQEKSVKYIRKPVDYSDLDDVGHGVKITAQPMAGNIKRPSAAVTIPRTPITSTDSGPTRRDSAQSSTSSHGTLRAVKAPTVPQEYAMNGQQRLSALFHHRTNSNSSTESGSQGIPVNIPPPPAPMHHTPIPYATGPDMSAHRTAKRNVPAPPFPPGVPRLPDTNGGYSIPHFVQPPPSFGGSRNVETYAATSVLNLPQQACLSKSGLIHPTRVVNLSRPAAYATANTKDHGGIPPPPPPVDINLDMLPTPPPPPVVASGFAEPDWVPKKYLEKMVVIYDYFANNPDELNLREDEIVYVVKMNDDGWYEGVLDGVTGLFPGNYAEPAT